MRPSFLAVICITLLMGQVSWAKERLLYSHEELQKLSWSDKKKYIRAVHEILRKMDEKSQYIAAIDTNSDRQPASQVPPTSEMGKLLSERMNKVDQLIKQYERTKDHATGTKLLKEAAYELGHTAIGIPTIEDSAVRTKANQDWDKLYKTLERKKLYLNWTTLNGEKKNQNKNFFDELDKSKKVRDYMKDFASQTSMTDEEKLKRGKEISDFMTYYKFDEEKVYMPAVLADRQNLRRNTPTAGATTSAPSAAPSQPTTPAPSSTSTRSSAGGRPSAESNGKSFFRCMYAGFVLKSGPCRAPSALPDGMTITGIDSDRLSCGEPQVLCNPLLFGTRTSCSAQELVEARTNEAIRAKCLSSAQPHCISRSRSATQDCINTSKRDNKSIEVAALLITVSPQTWDHYTSAFHDLCDLERVDQNVFTKNRSNEAAVMQDIRQTCQWARGQLLTLKDQFKIDPRTIDQQKLERVRGTR